MTLRIEPDLDAAGEEYLDGAGEGEERAAIVEESGGEPKSVSLAYCLANPAPALEWRTAGLLPDRGIAAMIGKPKIGKTVLAFQWGLCVAAGARWLPFAGQEDSEAFDCRPGRVLYVDEETGREVLESRLRRQMEADARFKDPETLERFRLVCFARFSLQEPKELRREIALVKPDFIIWDSFRRIFRGEENSSAEVSQAVGVLAGIRDETGCSQLVLHHTRKDPDGDNWADAARGSGDFFAAVDSMIAVSRVGKGLVTIRAVSRAAPEVDPFTAALEEETLTFSRTSAEASAGFDSEGAMAEILTDSPGQLMTVKTMRAALSRRGRTESQIRKAIAAVPTIDPEAPPAGCRIGKVPIPGTTNEKKLVLVG